MGVNGVSYGGDSVTGWERAGSGGRDDRGAGGGVEREAAGGGGDRGEGGWEARGSVVSAAGVARRADRDRSRSGRAVRDAAQLGARAGAGTAAPVWGEAAVHDRAGDRERVLL